MYIVDIMGGFGNQLFQICFALYLKKQGKTPYLYIFNKHEYSDHNFYMINDEDFNLIPINPTIENIIQKLKKIDIIDRNIFTIVSQESIEHIKKMEIKNKKFVTSFNGFWQDKFFVDEIFNEFKSGLLKTKIFYEAINKEPVKGSTMLHIRRGDHQAYLPLSYYEDAILKASYIDNFSFDIYTDDPNWVKDQNEFKKAKNIYGPSDKDDIKSDTLKTFAKMLNYENFIISNSTYSWWAAKISEKKHSKIYYPYPHWPGLQPDIYYDNWIKINR
jgi:hypothetical protein|tara:strand:+ start:20975 stop:21793 length:819 start_codon:yes stop_codon:yes gene_type:complete